MAAADYLRCDSCGMKVVYHEEDDMPPAALVFCNAACAGRYLESLTTRRSPSETTAP